MPLSLATFVQALFKRHNIAPFQKIIGRHKDTDGDLSLDMQGNVITGADPKKLLDHLFPEAQLPLRIDDLYEKLCEKGEVLPANVRRARWLSFPSEWGNPRNGETERQLLNFLDHLGDAISTVVGPSLPRRRWTSRYSSKSPKYSKDPDVLLDMYRKPDVMAVNDSFFYISQAGQMGWHGVEAIAELKTGAMTIREFLFSLTKDLGDRSFLIFEAQDGRRFIVYFGFLGSKVVITAYDRGGIVHTRPLEINQEADAKLFLHAFFALTFAPNVQIGHDPTIKYLENGIRTRN